ncbi:hypothetical protein NBRC116599_03600 [Aquicoccus sp. SU-CL01552]
MTRPVQNADHRARTARGGRKAPAPWGGGTGAARFAGKGAMVPPKTQYAQEEMHHV